MALELTSAQQMTLTKSTEFPPRIVDPRTNEVYVLVKSEDYERIKNLLDLDLREAYSLMDEVARREGWSDPALDIYNDLDPRSAP